MTVPRTRLSSKNNTCGETKKKKVYSIFQTHPKFERGVGIIMFHVEWKSVWEIIDVLLLIYMNMNHCTHRACYLVAFAESCWTQERIFWDSMGKFEGIGWANFCWKDSDQP